MSASDSLKRTGRRNWWPQIGLRTLLLLTACAAVWCGVWLAKREVERLQISLYQTRALARELVVKDRSLLTVIRNDERIFDEQRWQVYVPEPGRTIHLVTAGIGPTANLTLTPEASAKLTSGLHTVELTVEESGDQWLIEVDVDLENVIQLPKPKQWNQARGSEGGGNFDHQAEFADGAPAVLMLRRFKIADANNALQPHPEGHGVQCWIQ